MPKRRRDKDGLFKRDGIYYLQHKGKRVSLKTEDRETARRAADEYKRKEADPAHKAADLKRFEDACYAFRDYAETGENKKKPPSPETFEMYETHFGHFLRIWGRDVAVGDIDAGEVDHYIATRRKERIGRKKPPEGEEDTRRFVEANTVDKELGTLRQILRLGLRRGWYHLPLDRVLPESSGGEYVPLNRHLTLEQVPLLLDALRYPYSPKQRVGGYRGVYKHSKHKGKWEVKVSDDSGGRRKQRYVGTFDDPRVAAHAYDNVARELHGAKAKLNFPEGALLDNAARVATAAYIIAFGADWCAVERAERFDLGTEEHCNLMALIRGTKNKARWSEVPLVAPFQPFAELAREWLVKRGSFPAWGNSTRDLEAACVRAGLPRVTIRDLRRTHGKILAALGVDPRLIGNMLRHTDSRMAEKVYAKPERDDVRWQVAQKTRSKVA